MDVRQRVRRMVMVMGVVLMPTVAWASIPYNWPVLMTCDTCQLAWWWWWCWVRGYCL